MSRLSIVAGAWLPRCLLYLAGGPPIEIPGHLDLTIRYPPAGLSQNKGSWKWRAKRIRDYRAACCAVATTAMRGEGVPPYPEPGHWARAVLSIEIYMPDRRGRDTLNIVQDLKPAIDGVCARPVQGQALGTTAGLLPDDNWTCLSIGSIETRVDRDNPRVLLRFERREPV